MEKYGIDKQVLSLTSGTLFGLTAREASTVCRLSNEGISEFCQKRPDRFVGLAAISLLDVGSGLDELQRAVEDLGLKGVILATNQNGKGIDSADYLPFYERLTKFDIPVFLHPVNWEGYPLVDNKMMTIFGWPFDTTQAVWRLVKGGVLDLYPGLKVVTHHLGAMLPYFARRAETYAGSFKRKRLADYWRQIYADTAIDGAFEALPCAYSFFGSERLIFGTDYPFGRESGEVFIRDNLAAVRKMPIPEEEKGKIFSRNALNLLRIS